MGQGTPSQIVIRKDPLTDEEWQKLLEEHASKLKKMINRLTLHRLGDLRCLPIKNAAIGSVLRDCKPFVGSSPAYNRVLQRGLDLQGIFAPVYQVDRLDTLPEGRQYVWGYARPGIWVIIWLTMSIDKTWAYGTESSIAEAVMVLKATQDEICAMVNPRKILQRIHEVTHNAVLDINHRLGEVESFRNDLGTDIKLAVRANNETNSEHRQRGS